MYRVEGGRVYVEDERPRPTTVRETRTRIATYEYQQWLTQNPGKSVWDFLTYRRTHR